MTGSKPSRKDRLKPLELIGFSAALAIFGFLVVLMVLRSLQLASIVGGLAFIATLLLVALLGLGGTKSIEDQEARKRFMLAGAEESRDKPAEDTPAH